ncbi:hypothetical protein CPB84DRAFT_855763 [Gymnopilus junonius]|uniref:Uncharacterized protein n=1 Tax=Gymnopilus junonius TaxID=109634 RepID=A0A9P5N6Z1_GYMJU|nr:hypothetical protein CPB84DRAFT_855763 [Gymnopilus junonius]
MHEARWLGFEEGLKQGRQVQPLGLAGEDVDRQPSHRSRRSEDVSRYSYPDEDVVKSPSTTKLSARHHSSKSYSEYPTKIAPRTAPSTQTRQRHSFSAAPPPAQRTPNVCAYSQLLPRPTITTPMRLQCSNNLFECFLLDQGRIVGRRCCDYSLCGFQPQWPCRLGCLRCPLDPCVSQRSRSTC